MRVVRRRVHHQVRRHEAKVARVARVAVKAIAPAAAVYVLVTCTTPIATLAAVIGDPRVTVARTPTIATNSAAAAAATTIAATTAVTATAAAAAAAPAAPATAAAAAPLRAPLRATALVNVLRCQRYIVKQPKDLQLHGSILRLSVHWPPCALAWREVKLHPLLHAAPPHRARIHGHGGHPGSPTAHHVRRAHTNRAVQRIQRTRATAR